MLCNWDLGVRVLCLRQHSFLFADFIIQLPAEPFDYSNSTHSQSPIEFLGLILAYRKNKLFLFLSKFAIIYLLRAAAMDFRASSRVHFAIWMRSESRFKPLSSQNWL